MNRRVFFEKSGCCIGTVLATGAGLRAAGSDGQTERKKYAYEIEVVKAAQDTHCHKKGDTFKYPEELGKICPSMRDSMEPFMRVLQFGGVLPWDYKGTPYEKQMDPDGVTTEFVRCPDPTRKGIVVKIIRTRV